MNRCRITYVLGVTDAYPDGYYGYYGALKAPFAQNGRKSEQQFL